jgi:recombination protein RecR
MQFSSALLETAVNEFAKLPGIGKKTALRLVLIYSNMIQQQQRHSGKPF